MQTTYLTSQDGHRICIYSWSIPAPRALVHINHGMAEHAQRYTEFAQYLNSCGFNVVAHNHRGHGALAQGELQGHYADTNGWQKLLDDIQLVRNQSNTQQLPYILFGHSMGSFIAQAYALQHPTDLAALILSGSNLQPPALFKVAGFIAAVEKIRKGPHNSSNLLNFLSFGSFNNQFKPYRTDFDWLSRDNHAVDKYIADQYCGFDCSTQLWVDLLAGLSSISKPAALRVLPGKLPVYLFAGELDPVGRQGKGMHSLYRRFKKTGHENVTLQLYPAGRHEMLNELNKKEVMINIVNWLALQFAPQPSTIPLNGVTHGCVN